MTEATIAAIATPAGRGGLGMVRLSGSRSRAIAEGMLGGKRLEARRATYARFRDRDGALLDEVIATWFAAPASVTGEDVVEITAHGSPVLLGALLEAALAAGARLAEPGEFTRRAFLRGRLDLAQAEAVRDLIEAHTLFQTRTAARQLGGSLARTLAPWHERIIRVIARMEAGIDFADDDVPLPDEAALRAEIEAVSMGLTELEASFARGRTVREGLVMALVGRPNAGKSSLFNRLLGHDRAIVTPEPGTTRDLIAEQLDWEGIPVRLLDTAGLRTAQSEAERQGIERSWQALADADFVLAVADASLPPTEEDRDLLLRLRDLPQAQLVFNKRDLGRAAEWEDAAAGAIEVSALTGAGLDSLRATVRARWLPRAADGGEFITNARHAQQLRLTGAALHRAAEALGRSVPQEAILVDLYDGLRELDAITGQTTVEDILGVIFSTFCIGK